MDFILQQFKKLPQEIKDKVSLEEKVRALEEIEKKYNLKLAKTVVRVMIRDIDWLELEKFLSDQFNLLPQKAAELKKDLVEKIFNEVKEYLEKNSISERKKEEAEIEKQKAEKKKFVFDLEEKNKKEATFGQTVQQEKGTASTITPVASGKQLGLEEILQAVKDESGLVFEDEVLEHRFENIIRSYFKEIRDEIQVEETLAKPKKIGGLEFTPEKATQVVRIIKEYRKKHSEKDKNLVRSLDYIKNDHLFGVKKNDNNFKPTISRLEAEKEAEVIKNEETKEKESEESEESEITKVDQALKKRFESGAILPMFPKIEKPLAIPSASKTHFLKAEEISGNTKEVKKQETGSIAIKIKDSTNDEKLVKDVDQGRLRAVGPIEELAEMTLIDLQRWGGGEKTSQIILDKINLIGELSLRKKDEGIRAWQRSPLFKLYLEIGEEALNQKKTIHQIIQQREKNKQSFLTLEDFEAINELGRKLRF